MVPILHFMGGSAAEVPAVPQNQPDDQPSEQPAAGLRASDADRDQVVARLRDEFVAGRLSHDTFLHRIGVVLESRRQADLPPVVADLPAPRRTWSSRLRGRWQRLSGVPRAAAPSTASPPPAVPAAARRAVTTNLSATPDRGRPLTLRFPRGRGSRFSIGRDASCDLAIPDMTVSRRHAELERTQDGWLLSDLASTNGTRVNGWRVRDKVPVRPGDLVHFGDLQVFFRGDDPAG